MADTQLPTGVRVPLHFSFFRAPDFSAYARGWRLHHADALPGLQKSPVLRVRFVDSHETHLSHA